jgi:predicted Zn-dependent protease
MIKPLETPDSFHLEAAVGWLELGNHLEANEELDQITASWRAHPDVLLVRCEVYSKAKKWEMAAEISRAITELVPDSPFGWIHLAFALHEMQRTKEAWNVLLPVVQILACRHT